MVAPVAHVLAATEVASGSYVPAVDAAALRHGEAALLVFGTALVLLLSTTIEDHAVVRFA